MKMRWRVHLNIVIGKILMMFLKKCQGEITTQFHSKFARECYRYGVSDRAWAKIANGLLSDLRIVNSKNMDKRKDKVGG